MPNIVRFEQHKLEIITVNSRPYFAVTPLLPPLGITKNAVRNLYRRHKEKFSPDMSFITHIRTGGGTQTTRVYSTDGARLLAELANAPAFLAWLERLDESAIPRLPAPVLLSTPKLPACAEPRRPLAALSDEAKKVLRYRRMGLSLSETARLVQLGATTVGDISASLRSFGLLGEAHHG